MGTPRKNIPDWHFCQFQERVISYQGCSQPQILLLENKLPGLPHVMTAGSDAVVQQRKCNIKKRINTKFIGELIKRSQPTFTQCTESFAKRLAVPWNGQASLTFLINFLPHYFVDDSEELHSFWEICLLAHNISSWTERITRSILVQHRNHLSNVGFKPMTLKIRVMTELCARGHCTVTSIIGVGLFNLLLLVCR